MIICLFLILRCTIALMTMRMTSKFTCFDARTLFNSFPRGTTTAISSSIFINGLNRFVLIIDGNRINSVLRVLSSIIIPIRSCFGAHIFCVATVSKRYVNARKERCQDHGRPISNVFIVPIRFGTRTIIRRTYVSARVRLLLYFPNGIQINRSMNM